jgi:hypothetical protein
MMGSRRVRPLVLPVLTQSHPVFDPTGPSPPCVSFEEFSRGVLGQPARASIYLVEEVRCGREDRVTEAAVRNHAAFIWSVADLLRGDYKQSEYGKVILPLTVLRRLDCVLERTKAAVVTKAESLKGRVENAEPVLCAVSG